MQDDETVNVYNTQVDAYMKCVDMENPSYSLAQFIGKFGPNNLILDLGCGPGDSSAHMKAAGLDVDAVDASTEMVNHANDTYDLNARVATFNDITEENHYDGVWANFSLLHAPHSEFPRHLAAIHKALKPNGYFHIGAKLGTGEQRDKIGRFYSYYSEEELKQHLADAGFEVVTTELGKGKGLAGSIDPWITVLSRLNK